MKACGWEGAKWRFSRWRYTKWMHAKCKYIGYSKCRMETLCKEFISSEGRNSDRKTSKEKCEHMRTLSNREFFFIFTEVWWCSLKKSMKIDLSDREWSCHSTITEIQTCYSDIQCSSRHIQDQRHNPQPWSWILANLIHGPSKLPDVDMIPKPYCFHAMLRHRRIDSCVGLANTFQVFYNTPSHHKWPALDIRPVEAIAMPFSRKHGRYLLLEYWLRDR